MTLFGWMLFWDPTYMLIMGITMIPALWASYRVKSTFARYAKVGIGSGMSGAEAAAQVLRSANIRGVTIEPHQGFLSDHYDPRAKALRLSPKVYAGRTVAAVAVAAHEAGHAIQDDVGTRRCASARRSFPSRPSATGSGSCLS